MHFVAAIPAMHPIMGYGSPLERLVDDICVKPIEMNADGTVDLPTGAGLGVELSREKLMKYREELTI
jgi:L-alanine-DL-glutamate epimerase-like enolase superfamily enzyme